MSPPLRDTPVQEKRDRPKLHVAIAAGGRQLRLTSPYREHLAQHFAVTYSRIELPEPYETT